MTLKGIIYFMLENILDSKGNAIDAAKGSGHTARIPVSDDFKLDYALFLQNVG